jgi:hypothetical protein
MNISSKQEGTEKSVGYFLVRNADYQRNNFQKIFQLQNKIKLVTFAQ